MAIFHIRVQGRMKSTAYHDNKLLKWKTQVWSAKKPWWISVFVLTKTQDVESTLNSLELMNSDMVRWGSPAPSAQAVAALRDRVAVAGAALPSCPQGSSSWNCACSASWEPPASSLAQHSPPSCIIQLKYKIEHVVCALLNYLRKYYAGSYSTRQFKAKVKQIFPLKFRKAASQPWPLHGKGWWWKQARGKRFTIYWLRKQPMNDWFPAFLPCLLTSFLLKKFSF